jgi:hypothetical protein
MLSAASLVVTLAALEFIVFRYILVPDDVLDNVSIGNVVRYKPGTHATFRHPDGRRSVVTINRQGWNATRDSYARVKPAGRTRIAVLGDSYVHGAFVDVSQGFPEVLEQALNAAGLDAEVYRFGMDGAPLSQYLHMLRSEVIRYRPDVVLVPLVHNDFDESYRFLKTRYASSFMKLDELPDGTIREIPPSPFTQGRAELIRHSAMFRYLYYETGLYLSAKRLISRLVWGGNEDWSPEFISSAVDIRKIADHRKNRLFARYVMAEMKALAVKHGFKLAFMMDGVREAVYAGTNPDTYAVGQLNRIARDVTAELALPFLDLHEVFVADWRRHGQRFEFSYDWHWNERANRIVGAQAALLLLRDPRLLARRLVNAQ